jgi:hypothetical protein
MIRISPTILIGKVRSLKFVGPVVTATDDNGYTGRWQLEKVTVTPENVLRGRVRGRTIVFYFYMTLEGTIGAVNSLWFGERYVFFLTAENGTPRAIRDLAPSSIEVGTGRHKSVPFNAGAPIEERIAVLLLTPGDDDIRPRVFRRAGVGSVARALSWIGECRTAGLLRALSNDNSRVVRDAARNALKMYFGTRDPCSDK